ncbi:MULTISPECIES: hypothetical protein [unclassified Pseudomonas]|uniref:hypothetical protein n=1 Tax=unclassified Pseudomonas TaxID=196821 RepID=UPI001CBDF33D|nr:MULTISPECIES: hypothetical protein [unclassified Pseudomonas]
MGDIGAGGEHFFMAFCSVDGVTANKSNADKHGWDVFVEVEQETSELTQLTLHEPIIAGKVQVKSTRTTSLKVDVTLSNLRKMATSPLPSFYVLMDFSQGLYSPRAFIRHVDESLIREILERVNTHIIAGKAEKLHKLTLRIDFGLGREMRLSEPSTFKSEVLRAVGRSSAEYTDKKLTFLKTVGFEDGGHVMHFQLEGMENLTALVNASLGMGGSVQLQNLQFSTRRFGQVDPGSGRELSTGVMEITPAAPTARGTLTFRDLSTGASAQVNASAYASPMHAWLPEHLKILRFDCGPFDWLMNENGSSAQFTSTIDPDLPANLDELSNFFQIVCLLHSPKNLSIDMDFQGKQSSVTVKNGIGLPSYLPALETADLLLKIKSYFGDRGLLMVSVTELMRSHREIRGLWAFLSSAAGAHLNFRFDEAHEPFKAACLTPLAVTVGGKCYLALLSMFGDMSRLDNGRYTVATTGFDVLYKTVLREEEVNGEKILRQFERIIANYKHSLPVVNLVTAMLDHSLTR